MLQSIDRIVARVQSRPHRIIGFACGLFLPLVIAGLYWAQTTGGLAGPLVDPRPPAFTVPVD